MAKLISRRGAIIGGIATFTGGLILLNRPKDNSGPRAPYFLRLQDALVNAGIATPTLVIDLERLNANVDTLMASLPDGMGYRIVAKSLPSLELISHIRKRAGTQRLMTFNLPMLQQISRDMPDTDQLLGKPLPAAAAKSYFEELPTQAAQAATNVQWLIDTPRRLAQYIDVGNAFGASLRVNIELDIGLHRGGFTPGPELQSVLQTIRDHDHLSFAGFMGYDPHIASLPTTLGWRDRALHGGWALYGEAKEQARVVFGDAAMDGLVLNAAGSPTYRLYYNTNIANEISVGSALVKPTDFDTELLEPFVAAAFIATPVIKTMGDTRMPGIEFADKPLRVWDENLDNTVFIYGGHWLASPVDPPGLQYNAIFGRSSNQEMLNGGAQLQIAPDDFVFLRPHQSEALFMQFGDIAVYDDGAIIDRWPVFPASA